MWLLTNIAQPKSKINSASIIAALKTQMTKKLLRRHKKEKKKHLPSLEFSDYDLRPLSLSSWDLLNIGVQLKMVLGY